MSRRKKEEDEPIQGTWLNTYGDLVTLLLCFFILLFSMSVVDNMKFKKLLISFGSGATSILNGNDESIDLLTNDSSVLKQSEQEGEENSRQDEDKKFEEISDELSEFFDTKKLDKKVSVYSEQNGVLIRFNDSVLFDKGSPNLKENALQILADMATLLHKYDRMVKVEGHTDNDPISSPIYPSNWELSTARAVNVVRYFIEGVPEEVRIKPNLLQAAGYGEYYPIVENSNEVNKAKNRRIEIVILKNK